MKTSGLLLTGIVLLFAAGAAYEFYPRQELASSPAEEPITDSGSERPSPAEVVSEETPETPFEQIADDPQIARINGKGVHKSELIPYLQDVASTEELLRWGQIESIPPEVFEAALLNLAQDRLARQAADDAMITQRPEIKALMDKSANRIAKLAYLEQIIPDLVDDASIKRRYDDLVESLRGGKEYRARHILLQSEKEAKTILQALDRRPFGELAKLFSLDESTGLRGGDLGYFLPGTLDPDFESVVTRLKVGEPSKPFETRFGWHIAILDDVRDAQAMSFEQAEPVIRRQLEQQARRAWLDNLVSQAEITPLVSNVARNDGLPEQTPGTE